MKPEDLDRTLARETRQTRAEARDEIDALVEEILLALREGRPVELPGMGVLVSETVPEPQTSKTTARRKRAKGAARTA